MAAWEHIPYFAYGHNTNLEEMYRRVPEAQLLGHADLPDYRFVLGHVSNVIESKGDTVHGVLWIVPVQKLDKLDWVEGYNRIYSHKIVPIRYQGKIIKAMAYVMLNKHHNNLPPTAEYADWVATGYRENNIPLSQLITALEDRITQLQHLQK